MPGSSSSCGWMQLLDAFEDREQAADAEQHERDDERPEVAQRAVAERMHLVGRAGATASPPSMSRPWLPVSASEWIASASIDAAPVSANATNLLSAIPRFARNAAMIARLEP